ncbi:MBL fold metallo-hydrolase [Nocardiopsis metallicus]|uniref:Glyoxylase-like metal-dependent hydrolase (Beta-lactamase superfamily II) n=1 Tax=Nocardiopsis metallicus TaxID=179819 RepID=A0A840WIE2_9ACTN|nr:MBL fold metallo-hydrolase [Nocardiopsis metallicus]MBB5492771.1 glyoxylase-like metal-dependent hydrolase (beta-lactamase superfamily II) [Nocardiopsis metallicus]
MFWKRKSKKQDGQEATDSAVEVAEDTTEETGEEAVETEAKDDAAKTEDKAGERTEESDKAEDADADAEKDADAESADGADEKDGAETAAKARKSEKADESEEESKAADEDDEDEEVGVSGPDSDGIIRVRTAGTFEFDGEKFEVISNTWIIEADKDGVVIIDPAHDAEAIMEAVGDREVYLIACTNGYGPHIESALKIAEETEADIALHPREMRAWRRVHGAERRPEIDVEGEGALDIADLHIDVLALPGTTSGTVGFYVSQIGAVFSGDTLRKGEPGMVGNTYIDYTTQLASIGENLLSLPPDTRIFPDRGPSTTVEAEGRNFDSWV